MSLLELVGRDPGAEVLVVTNMWPDDERPVYGVFVRRQVESVRAAGVACDVLYLRGYRSPFAYPLAALRFLVSSITWRGRYRLVHVHAGETALAARFHARTPMLVSYCGDDVLGDPDANGRVSIRNRVRAWAIRQHSRLFPAIVTKTGQMAARLPGPARRKTTVLPNGVDRRLFVAGDRTTARQRLGWAQDERVALFAATRPQDGRKRLWLAEAACARAAASVGPIRLHVTGETPPDEMPTLMSAADCLLFTSSIEGSPNTIKEALMCGLPVVATPAGDVVERLAAVEPSWVCPPDADALAQALVECLSEPVRSNGREAAADLADDAVAQRLLELYRSLAPGLAAGRGPAPAQIREGALP